MRCSDRCNGVWGSGERGRRTSECDIGSGGGDGRRRRRGRGSRRRSGREGVERVKRRISNPSGGGVRSGLRERACV